MEDYDPSDGATDAFDRIYEALIEGLTPDLDEIAGDDEFLREEIEQIALLAQQVFPRRSIGLPDLPGYEILSELGHGGMGVVYLARQLALHGRLVAVKVLPIAGSISNRARSRFLLEAKALARVNHANVVRIFEVLEDPRFCAYAMEWIEGPSVATLVTRIGSFPAPTQLANLQAAFSGQIHPPPRSITHFWLRVGVEVARALQAVHAAGIIHRDVKPSNILLTREASPRLADFGLVRVSDASLVTVEGRFLGTPAYASPEQSSGTNIDPRCDLYSLGITLCYALKGSLPRLDEPRLPPLPEHSPQLRSVLAKATAISVEDRYATAEEFSFDLEKLIQESPPQACRDPRVVRWRRESPRRLRRVAMSAIAIVVCVIVAGLAWWLMPRTPLPAVFEARFDWFPQGYFSERSSPFVEVQLPGAPTGWSTVDVVDVNGDGHLDLVGHRRDSGFEFCLGLDTGGFQSSELAVAEPRISCSAWGDVDNDGDLDLVVGLDSQENCVWINSKEAGFSRHAESISSSHTTYEIALADLDGDGNLDMVQANKLQNRVLRGDGDGGFEEVARPGVEARAVEVADLDRDGNLDLIMPTQGKEAFWLGDGNFSFVGHGPVCNQVVEVAVGHVDADEFPDVFVSSAESSPNKLLFRDSSPSYTGDNWRPGEQNGPSRLALADFNRDGYSDVVEFTEGRDGVLRESRGVRLLQRVWVFPFKDPTDFCHADVSGDGYPDLVVTDEAGGVRLWVWVPVESRRFLSPPSAFADFEDFDGDGNADLLAVSGGRLRLHRGEPRAGFDEPDWEEVIPGRLQFRQVAVADFNGDTFPDFAVAIATWTSTGAPNRVFLSDGKGGFKDTKQELGSLPSSAILAVDINGDGAVDLIDGHQAGQSEVWINDGSGVFTESLPFSQANHGVACLTAVDERPQGPLTIVVGTRSGESSVIYQLRGPSSFEIVRSLPGFPTDSIVVADLLDQPGLEIAEIGRGLNAGMRIYSFSNGSLLARVPSRSGQQVLAVDLVGDSKLDLVVTGAEVELWIRDDSSEGFSRMEMPFDAIRVASGHYSFADLDRDGDLDAVSCHGEDGIVAWENKSVRSR